MFCDRAISTVAGAALLVEAKGRQGDCPSLPPTGAAPKIDEVRIVA